LINFRYVGKTTKITLKETASTFATPFTRENLTLERTQAEGFPFMGRGYGKRQHLRLSELWRH